MTSGKNPAILILVLLSVLLNFYANREQLQQPIGHDEVDYVVCAEKGIVHNALGLQTLSLTEFVHLGRLKMDKDSSAIASYSADLADPNEDVFVLRHYHPPLPTYYWSLFTGWERSVRIPWLRAGNWLFTLALGVLFAMLIGRLLEDRRMAIAGLLIWALLITSDLYTYSLATLNFHYFLAIAGVFAAYSLVSYIREPGRKGLWLLSASLAAMLLTLESSLFMIALMAGTVVLLGWWRLFSWKDVLKLIAFTVAITFLLWPAFLTKGELVKSFGMYFSRIFVNANLEYEDVDYLGRWIEVIKWAPVLFAAILWMQILAIREVVRSKDKVLLLPYIIGWSYCLLMTPFILNKTYIIPGVVMLAFASAYTFSRLKMKGVGLWGAVAGLCGSVLIMGTHSKVSDAGHDIREREMIMARVDQVGQLAEQGKVLAFPGHIYQYYFGKENIDALGHHKSSHYAFTYRYHYDRADISDRIEAGEYRYVVLPDEEHLEIWYDKLSNMGFSERPAKEGIRVFEFDERG